MLFCFLTKTPIPEPRVPAKMSGGKKLSGWQKFYCGFGAAMALSSVPMYLLRPDGAVKHFGGKPSPAEMPTAAFWCRLAAAGDVLIAYINIAAIRADDRETLKRVLWTNALYSLFHVGAFAAGHFLTNDKHPAGNVVGYGVTFAILPIVLWKWAL